MTHVMIVYDYIRLEEKLVIDALKSKGVVVEMHPVTDKPFKLGEGSELDVALIRTTSMFNGVYAAVALFSSGIRTVNQWKTILYSGDKALAYSLLVAHGIPTPETYIALGSRAVIEAAKLLGYPLVDKPPIGSWGRLVSLVYDDYNLMTIIEHREAMCNKQLRVHIVQEYVVTGNRDLRCLVLGGEMLGCVYRVARGGEWRSNVALGGETKPAEVTPELEELVLKTAAVFEGDFVSVDIFEHPDRGYVVNEVNGVPEFKGFMKATGVNVPEKLASYIVELAKR